MRIDHLLAQACEPVPGLLEAAIALLPEGLLIASVGLSSTLAGEPLVRAAARCLSDTEPGMALVEHVFFSEERLTVIRKGDHHPRLALVFVCGHDANLQFVIHATRRASHAIEATVDWDTWEA